MNRALPLLNLAGVAILALLCVLQWRANRQLHLDHAGLVRTSAAQADRIDELERQRRGLAADLDNFRGQLERSLAELRTTDTKLAAAEQNTIRLAGQNEQLEQSVAAWSAAVATRDGRLTEANERIRDLAARLDDSVVKFNDLARRYNDNVRLTEELGARYQEAVARLDAARPPASRP